MCTGLGFSVDHGDCGQYLDTVHVEYGGSCYEGVGGDHQHHHNGVWAVRRRVQAVGCGDGQLEPDHGGVGGGTIGEMAGQRII